MVLERSVSGPSSDSAQAFLRKRGDISIFPGAGQTLFTKGGVQDGFYREGDQVCKLSQ